MRKKIIERLNSNTRRIRQLEENLKNTEEEVRNAQERIIRETEDLEELKTQIKNRMSETEESLEALQVEVENLERKMNNFVSRREIREIEGYMDLMNPISSSFVTEEDVEELIEDKISKRKDNEI